MIRVWLRSHSTGWPLLAATTALIALGAWATGVAARRVAPADVLLDAGSSDPALLGPIIIAVACGILALALEDRMAWATDLTARPLGLLRSAWACTLILVVHILAALASPLIASGVQPIHVYWSFLPLWLGVMMVASVLGGPVVGSLAPVVVCLLLSLRALPWEANVAFNPALIEGRWGVGGAAVLLGVTLYGLHGARRLRGRAHRD